MSHPFAEPIAAALQLPASSIQAVLTLLDEGAGIPFIARYRKEATGSLDEVAIENIQTTARRLQELAKRRTAILDSLKERDLLTDELAKAVESAETLPQLEDIYLPFRPKRRTKATMAREKGLGPLADAIMQANAGFSPSEAAAGYIDAEKGVADAEDALAGARDIIAEAISENPAIRERLRDLFKRQGLLSSTVAKGKEEAAAKYRDYFDWTQNALEAPSHRVLAVFRGEREEVLKLSLRPPEENALRRLRGPVLEQAPNTAVREQIEQALVDAYRRLLAPSMETEIRHLVKEKADQEAIAVFRKNLQQLLMASPLGGRRLLAIDPGIRTGCKVVILDPQGNLIDHTVIYPFSGAAKAEAAGKTLRDLCSKHAIEGIAIGNGTGGRDTEKFVRGLGLPAEIAVHLVNESGASVYSASEVARTEFPDHDVTVRGAVSIGRRLMDPLAELVKIDPKSIGVGQYQHDVDQKLLKESLDTVVSNCVNAVGVTVNTASKELLTYVAGLGPQLAGNIVAYRAEHGPFATRAQLKKVPRLGPKAFEQCAGFLRIPDGKHPLDAGAVHPERYPLVERMAKDLGVGVEQLIQDAATRTRIRLEAYIEGDVGLPTLRDILAELAKPGRDPRPPFETFAFEEGVEKLEDLREGMTLPGIITNVTKFGAFVDVGVHQDGLVHVSQLADRFVKDPAEVVRVGQKVQVKVLEVDAPRRRISLSMKAAG